MTIPTKPLAAGGVVLGGSGAALGGTHLGTKQTIKDAIGIDLMDEKNADEEWRLKITAAKTDNTLDSKIFKSSNKNDEAKDRSDLFLWCKNQSEKSYGSALSSKDEKTLEKVKFFCALTIKEKLGSEWLFNTKGEVNKEQLKASVKKLKETTQTPALSEKFKQLQQKADREDSWKELRNLCKEMYKLGFRSSTDVNYLLVDKFCTKPRISDLIGDNALPKEDTSYNEQWKEKAEKALTIAFDESLKTAINKTPNSEDSKRKALQDWCQEQYLKPFDSKLTKNSEKKSLLEEVNSWCVYTIKDKMIKNSKTPLDPDSTDSGVTSKWESVFASLKSHSSSSPSLDAELTKIKTNFSDESKKNEGIVELKKWCKETYLKAFRTNLSAIVTLAETYCYKA